jgi:hypothetical protein
MNKAPESKIAEWTTPELIKLGQLKDVAPGVPGSTEGASGKS